MYSAQCIQKAGASLGESPVWDPEGRQLYWVDINNRHINRLDLKTGDTFQWPCHTEIGCIGLAKQGRLISELKYYMGGYQIQWCFGLKFYFQ